ncbi:hypothetical protein [Haloarcula mannanilytica]|uniref:hypothetical protein n=1 Tax=Haloarcula mannanilytica TaxID=2509225 RepID=UPI001359BEDF|nr:hypothetical protein [Haloarcula mannanilytica]
MSTDIISTRQSFLGSIAAGSATIGTAGTGLADDQSMADNEKVYIVIAVGKD